MRYCSNCGSEVSEEDVFCSECGYDLNDKDEIHEEFSIKKRCKHCGEMMPEDAFYCYSCGELFDDDDFEETQQKIQRQFGVWKNKWISLVLCILFGWLGAHKYYERKIVWGIVYMFTLGLFGFGIVVDIVILLFKPTNYRVR